MVYREGNDLLKILLVFVIAILFLTTVAYFVIIAGRSEEGVINSYLSIPNEIERKISDDMDEYLLEIVEEEEGVVDEVFNEGSDEVLIEELEDDGPNVLE